MDYFKEKFDGVLAKNLNVSLDELAPEKEFKQDFNMDSLDMIEMIIAFEKEFSINIPDEIADLSKPFLMRRTQLGPVSITQTANINK